MSMSTMMVYGFGFECDTEDSILVQFIKNHKKAFCRTAWEKDVYKKILTYSPKNQFKLADVICDYACDSGGCEGLGAVIANIMSREPESGSTTVRLAATAIRLRPFFTARAIRGR